MKRRRGKRTSSSFVPTRLLDITGPPGSNMEVIETGETIIRSPYATLSHCWGKKIFACLLPGFEKHFIGEGVPWQLLTTNFKQAVEVARLLGIEYIWIDSLCIIQGKDGDFVTEGAQMHSCIETATAISQSRIRKTARAGCFVVEMLKMLCP
jgi:hypothetical protein